MAPGSACDGEDGGPARIATDERMDFSASTALPQRLPDVSSSTRDLAGCLVYGPNITFILAGWLVRYVGLVTTGYECQ
jgi:hypothetical protein